MKNNGLYNFKKIQALLLAGALSITSVGCGKHESEDDDKYTINQVSHTYVATVNDEIAILQKESASDVINFVAEHNLSDVDVPNVGFAINDNNIRNRFIHHENEHDHYLNILTGAEYATDESCVTFNTTLDVHNNFEYADIEIIQQFSDFLTSEEILKAQNGGLTDEELISIVLRVVDEFQNTEEIEHLNGMSR